MIRVLVELFRDGVRQIIPVRPRECRYTYLSIPFRCASTVHDRTACTHIRLCAPLHPAKLVRNHYTSLAAHSELSFVTIKGVLALSPQAINIIFQHVRDWLKQVMRVETFVALALSNTEQLEQARRRALRHQAKLIGITSCKKSHLVGSESLVRCSQ